MIPTWTDHAHEARKHVRFARRNAVVSLLRYVAHLSATVQAGHPSAPQEPPMTTPEERHEADQDDADRYARTSVMLTSQRAHIAELNAEVERLRVKYNAALVTIERRTYDRNHPYGDVAPTEPAPDLEVTPDAPSPRLIQAGDHVYVWRESDVVDGMVHPLGHGVYVPHDVNPETYAFTVNGICKGCQS